MLLGLLAWKSQHAGWMTEGGEWRCELGLPRFARNHKSIGPIAFAIRQRNREGRRLSWLHQQGIAQQFVAGEFDGRMQPVDSCRRRSRFSGSAAFGLAPDRAEMQTMRRQPSRSPMVRL